MSSSGLIEEIKKLVWEDKIIISKHANSRMVERNVLADDIANLILNGEIIESYPDDFPCPSVLMFRLLPGKPCHVVVAKCLDYLRIVTVYLPDEDEWINCRERVPN